MKKIMLFLLLGLVVNLFATPSSKQEAIQEIRSNLAKSRKIIHWSLRAGYGKESVNKYWNLLQEDGSFSDIKIEDKELSGPYYSVQGKLGLKLTDAFKRIDFLAHGYNEGFLDQTPAVKNKILTSIIYYSKIELSRIEGPFRFHASCFAIPYAASDIYFCFFEDFDGVSKKTVTDKLTVEADKHLKLMVRQAFTQPRRDDRKGKSPYEVDQFRNHVLWVGGNFAYRATYEAGAICEDEKMLDVVAEICYGSLSSVSHNTYKTAFWTEGMTPDGAGWGHGRQCYIWGYPFDGMNYVLGRLSSFKNTPWEREDINIDEATNLAMGSVFYQWFNIATLMSPSRAALSYREFTPHEKLNRLMGVAKPFTSEAQDKVFNQVKAELSSKAPIISGARSFWNNDDLIYRDANKYIGISMQSNRTNSNEVVYSGSTGTDCLGNGATWIMTNPSEYRNAKGFWNLTQIPGTTNRKGELVRVDDWHGNKGKNSFAANVSNGEVGCAGYIDELAENQRNKNKFLFSRRGIKSYFIFEDTLVCLGNSIISTKATEKADILTNVDQSEVRSDIYVYNNNQITKVAKGSEFKLKTFTAKPFAIYEDGVVYSVAQNSSKAPVELTIENRKDDHFIERDKSNTKLNFPKSLDLFELNFNHGSAPKSDSYAYMVKFNVDDPNKMNNLDELFSTKIIANNSNLQAVEDSKNRTIQAIFYKSNQRVKASNCTFLSNAPIGLIVRFIDDKNLEITVADPLQNVNLSSVKITINLKLSGKNCQEIKSGTVVTIPLETGINCGKSVVSNFEIK